MIIIFLTPTPVKQDAPAHFKPSEIRSTIQPNTFTAHQAGLYSPKHIKDFWNRILLTKHSDETIQVLGKAISYDFFQDSDIEQGTHSASSYWTRQMRIGTADRIMTLNTFLTERLV